MGEKDLTSFPQFTQNEVFPSLISWEKRIFVSARLTEESKNCINTSDKRNC